MSDDGPIYLAGPMSGFPQFNYPAFDKAAAALRAAGYEIVSPSELDDPETREIVMASATGSPRDLPAGMPWSEFLARDIKIVSGGASGIALLRGWEQSRGARVEALVARLCGLPIYRYCPPVTDVQFPTTPAALVPMGENEIKRGIVA